MFIDSSSKLAVVILPLGFLIMPFMLWFEVAGFLGAYRSLRWPSTNGLVLLSEKEWFHAHPGIPRERLSTFITTLTGHPNLVLRLGDSVGKIVCYLQ